MTPAQVKPPISPELLDQIDVRVGTILSVYDVASSEKLVALEVNFGDHKPTANPREIEGKQALFVVNLPPRKWRAWSLKRCCSILTIKTESLEFCHHLDFKKFGFVDSWHTRDFYEQAAVLYQQARETPPKKLFWGANIGRALADRLAENESEFLNTPIAMF